MKRLVMAAVLLLGGALAAQADSDSYTDITRQDRSDAVLDADTHSCAQILGMPQNGRPTSAKFKRCMRGHGWRFDRTTREHLYPDPDDTGMMCKDVMVMGVLGTHCTNHW